VQENQEKFFKKIPPTYHKRTESVKKYDIDDFVKR